MTKPKTPTRQKLDADGDDEAAKRGFAIEQVATMLLGATTTEEAKSIIRSNADIGQEAFWHAVTRQRQAVASREVEIMRIGGHIDMLMATQPRSAQAKRFAASHLDDDIPF